MPDQLQLRGGTTAQHTSFTGASKEVTIDTTKKTAVVHDASTAGGNPLMREDGANSALINGSAAEPALAFAAGDADNGIYSPGADQVAVSTNGTERVEWGASEVVFNDGGEDYDFRIEGDTNANLFFVDASNDRVGIGIASPSYRLTSSISSTTSSLGSLVVGDIPIAAVNTGSATANQLAPVLFRFQDGTYNGNSLIAGVRESATGRQQSLVFAPGDSSGDPQERLRIDSDGRLLVGTASDLTGDELQINDDSAGAGISISGGVTDSGAESGRILFRSDTGNQSRISSRNDGAQTSGSNPGRLEFATTADGASSPTERMRITSNGRIGIGGVTDPQHRLHLNGDIRLDDASPRIEFHDNNASSNTTITCGFEGYDQNGNRGVFVGATEQSNTLSFGLGNQERARIDSAGRLLVGTSSARTAWHNGTIGSNLIQIERAGIGTDASISLCANSGTSSTGISAAQILLGKTRGSAVGATDAVASGDCLGRVSFQGSDGTQQVEAAKIETLVDGTSGANDMPGRLVFYTTADGASSPTERMRIQSNGDIRIGQTTTSQPGDNNNTTGLCFRNDNGSATNNGRFYASAGADHNFNRTSDGTILAFRSAGTNEGAVSISGTTVTYGGGHLARWSQLLNNADPSGILKGTVMSNLDEMCEWGEEDNEQLNRTKVSDVEGDSNVAGVFVSTSFNDEGPFDFYVGMTGDMVIRIAQGTTVARGDLLMSAGDGTAKPQDDDIIRSKTIAKVTSTHVSETYADGSYCVPCVLMAC
jgi:hypothetical protein